MSCRPHGTKVMSDDLRGVLLALAGFAVFALHDAVVKALGAQFSAVQIVFFAALLGLPAVMLALILQEEGGSLRPRRPGWTALRTIALVGAMLTAFYAFSVIPLAQTYALIFTTPLIITALSVPVLGERVGWRRWSAVLLGLAGVLLVLRPTGEAPLSLGHAAALASALCGALVAVIMRKIGHEERSAVLLLYPILANLAVTGVLLPAVYAPMSLLQLAGMAFVGAGALIAMLFLIAAYRAAEAAVIAPMQYSQMIWAVVLGAAFFAEWPDLWTVAGSAVIVASGMVVIHRENRSRSAVGERKQ